MFPYELDVHTHTVSSGHYTHDTITDMARCAAQSGIKLLGISEHGPAIPHSVRFPISEASPWPPAAAWASMYYTARKPISQTSPAAWTCPVRSWKN